MFLVSAFRGGLPAPACVHCCHSLRQCRPRWFGIVSMRLYVSYW